MRIVANHHEFIGLNIFLPKYCCKKFRTWFFMPDLRRNIHSADKRPQPECAHENMQFFILIGCKDHAYSTVFGAPQKPARIGQNFVKIGVGKCRVGYFSASINSIFQRKLGYKFTENLAVNNSPLFFMVWRQNLFPFLAHGVVYGLNFINLNPYAEKFANKRLQHFVSALSIFWQKNRK